MSTAATNSGSAPLRRSHLWLLAFLAALGPAIFTLSTNNIWEDFFITYRCSLNLAQGHGLVYEVGRTVHVFTSPLGVLLPAGISWLLRTPDPQMVIDVFRLCGCLALVGAWSLAIPRLGDRVALAVTAGLWLLDVKLAAYSTNGMETAYLVLFVVLTWRALVDGDMRLAGIALGGVMWTRPDGFVYVGALAAAAWIFQRERRRDWAGWFRMAAYGAVIYTPWVLWAWWYYGSPIPNTILAKSSLVPHAGDALTELATYPLRLLFGHVAADDAFKPPYFFFGGWPPYLWVWSKALTLGAVAAVVWPRCARPARIAGLAFVLGGIYLDRIPGAPWYYPAWQVLAYIAIGGVAAALAGSHATVRRSGRLVLVGGAALLILTQAALFLAVTLQLREQQNLIEWGLRAPLGRDLRQWAASPRDTVFLEPLGYIGFFSGLAMRDTPGLCAPEVVALRRAGKLGMMELAVALDVDWVVLRGHEYGRMTAEERADFRRHYQLRKIYDARPQVEALAFLPTRDLLRYDAVFLLWQRQAMSAPPPAATATGPGR